MSRDRHPVGIAASDLAGHDQPVPHRVVVVAVAVETMQLLDLAGPTDVVRAATLLGADPGDELRA